MLPKKGVVDHSCLCRQIRRQPDKGLCATCKRDVKTIRQGMDIAIQYLAGLSYPRSDLVNELVREFSSLYQMAMAFEAGVSRPISENYRLQSFLAATAQVMKANQFIPDEAATFTDARRYLSRAEEYATRSPGLIEIEDIWVEYLDTQDLQVDTGILARCYLAFLTETQGLSDSEIWRLAASDKTSLPLRETCGHFPVDLKSMLNALEASRKTP